MQTSTAGKLVPHRGQSEYEDVIFAKQIAELYALFGGGVQDGGWVGEPKFSRARLAIVPGYTHYNFDRPDIAGMIERYLTNPTWKATQFEPEPKLEHG